MLATVDSSNVNTGITFPGIVTYFRESDLLQILFDGRESFFVVRS